MRVLTSLDELVTLVDQASETLYLRFSDGPQADASSGSVDYESGLELPGLSANRLSPESWWTRPVRDWVARHVCQYKHLVRRSSTHRGWVLAGSLVGRGPDDEPLLGDVRPIAWLDSQLVAEADRWYRTHFNVGQVSR